MWDGGFFWLQGELTVEGTQANLTVWDPQKDLTVRVCVSNAAGYGPWSQPLVVSSHDHSGKAYRGQELRVGAFKGTLYWWEEAGSTFPPNSPKESSN